MPNFAVVYAIAPFSAALTDPQLDANLMMLVHGEQSFVFHEVVRPGDVLSTAGVVKQVFEKADKDFVIFETTTHNQRGALVTTGGWTAVIRR
jgi:acyl dehydratase